MSDDTANYIYCEIRALDSSGANVTGKFFLGRLPLIGEAVEQVYIGSLEDGTMQFQLRAVEGDA